MTSIKEQLRQDLTTAMKAGDRDAVGTIRMVLTSVSKAEVSGDSAKELDDAETTAVLTSEAKRRKEAAEEFERAGRQDLANKERAEAEVLARYLPDPLSATELDQLITAAVDTAQQAGLSGGRAMGAVMKDLKQSTVGRVDGADLASAVKQALGLG
ncbi:MAG: glutamyl-tRNA amidotransferase [Micrococcales bacterium]|nr:glutamyl-tRNA amidotransferase [Micrococcales bacterium]